MDHVIRRQSEQINSDYDNENNADETYDYKKWEWGYLRKECKNFNLEPFYETYVKRLQKSYVSIFLGIHTIIGIIHAVVVVAIQSENSSITPEIYCYIFSILIVWICLMFVFNEELVQKYTDLPYILTLIAVMGMVLADIIVPVYHATLSEKRTYLRPAYTSYILFAIYILLPLSENIHCIILGSSTTICYLLEFIFITYKLHDDKYIKTVTEFIFLFFVNFFGFYFRLMNEVAIRRAFLDRRGYVIGNLLLKHARDQEKNLLLSILPRHTAGALEKAIQSMIDKIRNEERQTKFQQLNPKNLELAVPTKKWRGQAINKLYVEHHTGVTVLYADVVNYTYMTTQLPVKQLVETLHELFVKFDQASEEFNVLRIKFLGDCYYCVSGVPEHNPFHAKSCVDLGLQMIRDIREVREKRNNLNIDMRIGIHSGSIISGVIGACKWQYDIWSKDASIANRLESTGVPGKVHVTKQTLDMLNNEYEYEIGTDKAKNDSLLQANHIQTYLISPNLTENSCGFYTPDDNILNNSNRRISSGVTRKLIANRLSKTKVQDPSIRRNFMQNSMEQYMHIIKETEMEMSRELDQMPIGKFDFNRIFRSRLMDDSHERKSFSSNVSTFLLRFKNKRWEFSFMKEPDLMLKYSTFLGLIVFLGIFLIQIIDGPTGLTYWILNGLTAIVLTSFIPITWFKKLWILFIPVNENNYEIVAPPNNKFFKFLYNKSRNIMRSATSRTIIYLFTMVLIIGCSLIHLVECPVYDDHAFMEIFISVRQYKKCFNPWAITQSLLLAICMNFLFVRINFILKLIIGCVVITLYSWIIFGNFAYQYEESSSINPEMDPKMAHILTILFTLIIFHLIDRQTEYIARVDYNWKQQLQKKHEETEYTKDTIKVLIHNILPVHVAEIYLSRKMKDELYYEEYENVAIMFATILNYDVQQNDVPVDTEKNILSILNRIICDFDEQLLQQTGSLKIEKIKVAGWTYMLACGLDPGRSSSSASLKTFNGTPFEGQRESFVENGRRSTKPRTNSSRLTLEHEKLTDLQTLPNGQRATQQQQQQQQYRQQQNNEKIKSTSRQSQNVVYVMAEFALKLIQTLDSFNKENFKCNGQLRIGISHGKVMAGVVGSSKPLYDVWGNAVNMASRMDSTGLAGTIQVTQETAEVLQSFGIKCDYRGQTFVKGRGNIPTYFIDINEELQFIKIKKNKPLNAAVNTPKLPTMNSIKINNNHTNILRFSTDTTDTIKHFNTKL